MQCHIQTLGDELNLDELLLKCIPIAQDAGAIVKARWDKPHRVQHKGAIDLVTETDQAVEDFLRARLMELLPGAAFLGEESAKDSDKLLAAPWCWVVDPVDGTTNFVHDFLPFRYIVFEPVAILLNTKSFGETVFVLEMQLLWIAVLFCAVTFAWHRGRTKIMIQGG